ncbi:glycosyltransferase [Dietzia sp. CW19]|uniref:Glycosyltransferase n=1 Tax=Dietzia maris TaxID=37915 RepID=A0AAE4QY45_9ACTN|nr:MULTISPECIES: glycosyltransferase [Dietzia]MBB1052551.1 glycosyltransferase [Dietzia sp. CW19]MDV6298598.1 glycosyltransferase [Dietzia maris]
MKFSAEDVVIVRVPETLGLALGSVAGLQGAQVVANVVAFPDAIGSGTPLLGAATNPLVRKLSQRIVSRAAAVVYVTRKALQNALPPPAAVPTFTKSNIVFPDYYFADQAKDTFDRAELQLITVGSLNGSIKGVDTVLRALSILVRKGVNFQFTVVGEGTSRTGLEELARDLGLAERVRFLGQIDSKSVLVRHLKHADLFVLASRTEGLPRAMIEASAVGLPAIGSRVGGIPELVPSRALFDSGDYDGLASLLESLHSNRSLLATLAEEQHHNAVDLIRTARTPIFRQVIDSVRAQRRPAARPLDR